MRAALCPLEHAGCFVQRARDGRAALLHLQWIDRPQVQPRRAVVGGERRLHEGVAREGHHADAVAAELVEQLLRGHPRGRQPVGHHVGGEHRARGVERDHQVDAPARHLLLARRRASVQPRPGRAARGPRRPAPTAARAAAASARRPAGPRGPASPSPSPPRRVAARAGSAPRRACERAAGPAAAPSGRSSPTGWPNQCPLHRVKEPHGFTLSTVPPSETDVNASASAERSRPANSSRGWVVAPPSDRRRLVHRVEHVVQPALEIVGVLTRAGSGPSRPRRAARAGRCSPAPRRAAVGRPGRRRRRAPAPARSRRCPPGWGRRARAARRSGPRRRRGVSRPALLSPSVINTTALPVASLSRSRLSATPMASPMAVPSSSEPASR